MSIGLCLTRVKLVTSISRLSTRTSRYDTNFMYDKYCAVFSETISTFGSVQYLRREGSKRNKDSGFDSAFISGAIGVRLVKHPHIPQQAP